MLLEITTPILLAATAVDNSALADRSCELGQDVVFFDRLSAMPPAIQDNVAILGPMAERDAPYNASHAIHPNLPMQRFVRGGRKGNLWFVWFESGGISHRDEVLGWYPLQASAQEQSLVLAASFTGKPCQAIDAFLSGVISSPRIEDLDQAIWYRLGRPRSEND